MNARHSEVARSVAIGLGSSLGDRRSTLENALRALGRHTDTVLLRASAWYRTPPLAGGSARGWFLNGVGLYQSSATPEVLLDRCRDLENRAGRRRAAFWGDRPLDLDILFIEGEIINEPWLQIPHPAWRSRPFVVRPLREVWPEGVDPVSGERFGTIEVPAGPRPMRAGVVARDPGPVTTAALFG